MHEAVDQSSLPRSVEDGRDLHVVDSVDDIVIITDGERTASYVRFSGVKLAGKNLRILPYGIQAGRFGEANVVTITDGARHAVFVPKKKDEVKRRSSRLPFGS